MSFATFYQRSIDDPSAFWGEQARRIDWHHPFLQVLDDSRPPFAKWFFGGTTNLCHNAVDCWLATRGDQPALIAISTETNTNLFVRRAAGRGRSYRRGHAIARRWP